MDGQQLITEPTFAEYGVRGTVLPDIWDVASLNLASPGEMRVCNGCHKPKQADQIIRTKSGLIRCRQCAEGLSRRAREVILRDKIEALINAKADAKAMTQPVISTGDIGAAFLEEFQGPRGFAKEWANQIKHCIRDKPGSTQALRAFVDAARFIAKAEENTHKIDMDNMSIEELQREQKRAMLSMLGEMVDDETARPLLTALIEAAKDMAVNQVLEPLGTTLTDEEIDEAKSGG